VVGIFPDDASVIRLVSMLAIEANKEWLVGRSYISRGSMSTLYETRPALAAETEEAKEVSELIAA
jgi:transposase-like protein